MSAEEAALQSVLEDLDSAPELIDKCRSLLSSLSKYPDHADTICKQLADLGRQATFRDIAHECSLLPSVVPLLSSNQSDVRLQAMRAIGNMCIDHDTNRETVLANEGCPYLISQLARCSETSIADSKSVQIKCVTCGCILNLSNENEKLQKEFNSLGVLPSLSELLLVTDQDETVLNMALQTVSILLEQADLSNPSSTCLPSSIMLLLSRCVRKEIDLMENVFEVFETLINKNDEWKRSLVDLGCVDHLLEGIEPELEQKANDFLVTLLGEDKCLEVLFKDGKVLSQALTCLTATTSSLQQRANSALVVANMARTEENCRVLVDRGAVPLLIGLTKMEETKELMGKLHHSALSALRNLSLPGCNKQLFLECGVVECALSLLTSSTLAHVWFKALGILRLLVDKQAPTCSYIVSQRGSIERVCEVCSAVGPAHLQLEGSRLLAAIVKNCQDNDVMCKVVSGGGANWICLLLESEHGIMVNEGLLSLILLAATKNDVVYSALDEPECSIESRLSKVLSLTSLSPEIVSNALVLLETLLSCDRDPLKSKLRASKEMVSSLEGLSKHSVQDISSRALKLTNQITE